MSQPAPLPVTDQLAHALLSSMRVAVVHVDAGLNIVAHTPELQAYAGEATDTLLAGEPLLDLFPELIGCEEDLESVAAGVKPLFEMPMINRLDAVSGKRRYFSLTALPQLEAQGQFTLLVQDVTNEGILDQQVMQQLNEVRLLRARLERANQDLAKLNDEKSAFLRMAAHDLRAPLTVIRGYVEMVMEDTGAGADEEAMDYLDVVMRRTRQMAHLIDNLLDVEKIESGTVSLDLQPVDLADLIEEVGRGFQPVAEQKDQQLHWQVPTGLPHPLADGPRLIQVLNNLVSNALKFTPSGGQVGIKVRQQESQIVVEVSDTGPGISEEDQKRLFQRFFRANSVRQQRIPGTGLGLSIVRAIIQQHGGQAYCRSELGVGTTFGFTLPVGDSS